MNNNYQTIMPENENIMHSKKYADYQLESAYYNSKFMHIVFPNKLLLNVLS